MICFHYGKVEGFLGVQDHLKLYTQCTLEIRHFFKILSIYSSGRRDTSKGQPTV